MPLTHARHQSYAARFSTAEATHATQVVLSGDGKSGQVRRASTGAVMTDAELAINAEAHVEAIESIFADYQDELAREYGMSVLGLERAAFEQARLRLNSVDDVYSYGGSSFWAAFEYEYQGVVAFAREVERAVRGAL